MLQKDLKLISELLRYELFNRIVFQDYEVFRHKDLSYYQKLLENYYSYDMKNEIQLRSVKMSVLSPTLFDEIVEDELRQKDFFIDVQKVSLLLLNLFEDNFSIDSKFFDSIRDDLKNLILSEEEIQRLENIIDKIEEYALSENWKVDFVNQLSDSQDIWKVISHPSFFIVWTLIKVWMNF